MDIIIDDSTRSVLADPKILQNPALRSMDARAELRSLSDALLLSWQVKWTKSFIRNGTNMTEEQVMGHGNAEGALAFAASALQTYQQHQALLKPPCIPVGYLNTSLDIGKTYPSLLYKIK